MRTKSNVKRAVDSLLSDASGEVEAKKKAIRVFSKLLAEYMSELHGGDWKVQIDHKVGLVAVSQDFDGSPVDKSNNGEN